MMLYRTSQNAIQSSDGGGHPVMYPVETPLYRITNSHSDRYFPFFRLRTEEPPKEASATKRRTSV